MTRLLILCLSLFLIGCNASIPEKGALDEDMETLPEQTIQDSMNKSMQMGGRGGRGGPTGPNVSAEEESKDK